MPRCRQLLDRCPNGSGVHSASVPLRHEGNAVLDALEPVAGQVVHFWLGVPDVEEDKRMCNQIPELHVAAGERFI